MIRYNLRYTCRILLVSRKRLWSSYFSVKVLTLKLVIIMFIILMPMILLIMVFIFMFIIVLKGSCPSCLSLICSCWCLWSSSWSCSRHAHDSFIAWYLQYFHVETSGTRSSVQAVRLATLRAEVSGNQVADILGLYLACMRGCVNHFFYLSPTSVQGVRLYVHQCNVSDARPPKFPYPR
jgi:hypothetical protein